MRIRFLVVLASMLFPILALAKVEIRFETAGVVVKPSARGGRVVCMFGDRLPPRLIRTGSFAPVDTDNDGDIPIPLPNGSTDLAVWSAVDFETGEFTVATPSGVVGEIGFRGHKLNVNSAGQLRRLETENLETLQILLVRPREGAWSLRGADGGRADSDGRNDMKFELDIESLQPLPGFGPPPKHFAKGDVLIIIDPIKGDVFATTVGK
jgi:hypothetical protein